MGYNVFNKSKICYIRYNYRMYFVDILKQQSPIRHFSAEICFNVEVLKSYTV